jgi:hypothetical protein
MKKLIDATALALVWALGVGVVLLGPSPAQAAGCTPVAALDLDGDGWIDTPERHAAMDHGFTNIRSGGRLYTTDQEMSQCLQGSDRAFRWLQQANPNFAAYSGGAPAYPTTGTAASGVPSYDSGAAFDTPSPQAAAEAKAYLESKTVVGPDGSVTEVGRSTPAPAVPAPEVQSMMPSAAAPSDFEQMDANQDGIVSRQEYLDFMNRTGRTY